VRNWLVRHWRTGAGRGAIPIHSRASPAKGTKAENSGAHVAGTLVIEVQDTKSTRVAKIEHHRIQMSKCIPFKTINSTH
jgi:hypothetical protein